MRWNRSSSETPPRRDALRRPGGEVPTLHIFVRLTSEGVQLFPIVQRYTWPSELDLMARIAGLRLKERWDGWNRQPFTSTGNVVFHLRTLSRDPSPAQPDVDSGAVVVRSDGFDRNVAHIGPRGAGELSLLVKLKEPEMTKYVGGPESSEKLAEWQSRFERPDSLGEIDFPARRGGFVRSNDWRLDLIASSGW